MTPDRAALEKAAMLVLMNGSGRITQELWADILSIIDLIRNEVLEEAARICDSASNRADTHEAAVACGLAAEEIRALKDCSGFATRKKT